ncbi:UNVERIFIED_CONTAM: hypothetical protein HHA_235440 [Hammondia hammondi]|eukprot:XP_008885555.1 hypothetical protein HHA_235440 [Hammondia hammondi]
MQSLFEEDSFAASCLLLRQQLARATCNKEGSFDRFFQLLCNAVPLTGGQTDDADEIVKITLNDSRELRGNLLALDAKGNILLQNCRMRTCVRYRDEKGRSHEEWRECAVPVPLVCPLSRVTSFKAQLDSLFSISATMQNDALVEAGNSGSS